MDYMNEESEKYDGETVITIRHLRGKRGPENTAGALNALAVPLMSGELRPAQYQIEIARIHATDPSYEITVSSKNILPLTPATEVIGEGTWKSTVIGSTETQRVEGTWYEV